MRKSLVTVVVVVAAGAAAVAWTASLDGSTARANFAGHADQLCDTYHQAVGDLGRPGILADVPGWAAREKPFARSLAEQLDALDPPAAERKDFARFRALVRRQLTLLDAQSRAGHADNQKAFDRAAAESHRVHTREGVLGKRLGFLVCGR
jgi:hypothetical protein